MTKQLSETAKAILEMADDQRRVGIMDKATHDEIVLHYLGPQALKASKPVSGPEIRSLRESAKLSQTAFARSLNLTPGYISQLERGVKQPKDPALALFNLLRSKGVEMIL